MANESSSLERRSLAVIGHSGVGKTPLCEQLLFSAGAISRIGKTSDSSSHLDFEAEEIKRDTTLKAVAFDFQTKSASISLVDTPGSSSFLVDTVFALHAVDSALLIVSASAGVKIQGRKAWKQLVAEDLARAIFVNELEREEASLENAVEAIGSSLGVTPVCLHLPIGRQADFKGIVDLLEMKAYLLSEQGGKKPTAIPSEMREQVEAARGEMIERISETDDTLLEKYLEEGSLDENEILPALKNGIANRTLVPLFCGSSESGIGIPALLRAIESLLPGPAERRPYQVSDETDNYLELTPSANDDFVGIVFKTIADPFTGQISLLRVISGTLQSDASVHNMRSGSQERVGKLHLQQGKEHSTVSEAGPGAIVSLMKLKDTRTGDTLCATENQRTVKMPEIPEGGMKFAVEAKTRGDEEKVFSSLDKLAHEDPGILIHREPSTSETIVTCMGQQHMDITIERIQRKFHASLELHTPKVPYRETIKSKAEAQGRHKKQSGGRGQFGDCWLRLAPRARGEGFAFHNEVFGGAIPKNYIPAVEKGVVETMEKGHLAGFPIVDLECTVYDGSYHSVDSSDMAFKIAAGKGFRLAMEKAHPVLLEPVMTAEIVVPDETTGDVVGDLNSRRGKVLSMEPEGDLQIIRAEVPLAEMMTYTPSLRSMTSDRGEFHMEFCGYEEAPAHIAQKVIEENKKEDVADE